VHSTIGCTAIMMARRPIQASREGLRMVWKVLVREAPHGVEASLHAPKAAWRYCARLRAVRDTLGSGCDVATAPGPPRIRCHFYAAVRMEMRKPRRLPCDDHKSLLAARWLRRKCIGVGTTGACQCKWIRLIALTRRSYRDWRVYLEIRSPCE